MTSFLIFAKNFKKKICFKDFLYFSILLNNVSNLTYFSMFLKILQNKEETRNKKLIKRECVEKLMEKAAVEKDFPQ